MLSAAVVISILRVKMLQHHEIQKFVSLTSVFFFPFKIEIGTLYKHLSSKKWDAQVYILCLPTYGR